MKKQMSIRDYIKKNWNDSCFDVAFSIKGYSKRLEAILLKNPGLTDDIKPILACKTLSRKRVFEWVKRDPYQGYLAAMLWGGISTMDSNKKPSNAEMAFSVDKKKVVAILAKTTELLKQGNEGEAFEYLYSGEGKINGIGISYLTKIMYFFSPDEPEESLIFDKWGRFMHAAFLIDDHSVIDFYSFKYNAKFKSELCSKKPEKEVYLDYLNKMRSVQIKGMASPGHLEAYKKKKKLYKNHQNDSNPRYVLYNKVKNHFTGNTSQATTPIEETNQTTIKNRRPTKANRVLFHGTCRYVFIGEDKQKAYCEVLSLNGYYPEEHELMDKGFVKKGGKSPYYIATFKKDEIEKAAALLNDVLELYCPKP